MPIMRMKHWENTERGSAAQHQAPFVYARRTERAVECRPHSSHFAGVAHLDVAYLISRLPHRYAPLAYGDVLPSAAAATLTYQITRRSCSRPE